MTNENQKTISDELFLARTLIDRLNDRQHHVYPHSDNGKIDYKVSAFEHDCTLAIQAILRANKMIREEN